MQHRPTAQRARRPGQQPRLPRAVRIGHRDAGGGHLVATRAGPCEQRLVDAVASHQLDGLGRVDLRLGGCGRAVGLGQELADGVELVGSHGDPSSNACLDAGKV